MTTITDARKAVEKASYELQYWTRQKRRYKKRYDHIEGAIATRMKEAADAWEAYDALRLTEVRNELFAPDAENWYAKLCLALDNHKRLASQVNELHAQDPDNNRDIFYRMCAAADKRDEVWERIESLFAELRAVRNA